MSKRKSHVNIKKRGGSDQFEPMQKKKNARLRPAKKERKPDRFYLWFMAFTALCLAAAFVLK